MAFAQANWRINCLINPWLPILTWIPAYSEHITLSVTEAVPALGWLIAFAMAEGDGAPRNFRSSYYEKLGFCGNEEKNILDMLLSSDPFDLEKLSELSERFDVDRRCVEAWKVILGKPLLRMQPLKFWSHKVTNIESIFLTGVESNRKNPFDDFANVKHVRAEHFQSLKHHVEVLLRHNLVMRDRLKRCSNSEPKPLENHNHSQENSKNYMSQSHSVDELKACEREVNNVNEDQKDLGQSEKNNGLDHTLENLNLANSKLRKRQASIDEILGDIEVSS